MKNRQRLYRVLPWLVLAAAYLFTVGMFALYGSHNLDSDLSSEMVLADLLNEEGGFLSENWYYSSELRVVSHVPAYQLGLLIFPDNWHAAHTLAMAVLHAIFAAAMIYLGRSAGLGSAGVYAAAALMLPVSGVHKYLFSFGGGYVPFIALACVLMGMVLRMPGKKRRALRLTLLAVLSLWGGLSGVRMPMISGAPLMLACALEAFAAVRKTGSLREAVKTEQALVAGGAGLSTASMLAGYVVNVKVLKEIYHFQSYDQVKMGALDLSVLLDELGYVAEFFGYEANVPLMSLAGVSNMLALGLAALMGISLFALLKKREALCAQQRILVYFAAIAVPMGMMLNILTGRMGSVNVVGYYMMGLFMLAMLLFINLEKMNCRMEGVRTAALLAAAAMFFIQARDYTQRNLRASDSQYEEAAAWLVQNGYENGYATFWNGNVLAEAGDGRFDMYVYNNWTDDELYAWLQRTDHMETMPQGRVFVYVEEQELLQGPVPCALDDHLVWEAESGSGKIYAYESAQEVDALQREGRAKLLAERAAQEAADAP